MMILGIPDGLLDGPGEHGHGHGVAAGLVTAPCKDT